MKNGNELKGKRGVGGGGERGVTDVIDKITYYLDPAFEQNMLTTTVESIQ